MCLYEAQISGERFSGPLVLWFHNETHFFIQLDGSAASTFNHHISSLLKYFGFNHVWDNKTTLSVPRLINTCFKNDNVQKVGRIFLCLYQGNIP